MRLYLCCLIFLTVSPLSGFSTYLPSYDIWNDGAKINKKLTKHEQVKKIQTQHDRNDKLRKGKSLAMFNFFFSNEEECLGEEGRRSGLCLNPYACRRRGGTSSGYCAHGFGVCCIVTVTCGQEIQNNITYFVSPQFPSLARSMDSCTVMIKKMDTASQLRLDFLHFNLGQPNRMTGDCDSDAFILAGGNSKDFKLCGLNNNQHIYYDIDKAVDRVVINMRLLRPNIHRIWEIKVMQIPFAQRAPAGCLQYFTERSGFIQTLNFAENGRHLANQDYKACIKPRRRMCSVAYEPCDSRSFRIGPNAALQGSNQNSGEYIGSPSESPMGETIEDNMSGDGPIIETRSLEESKRQFTNDNPYKQHLKGIQGVNADDQQLWRYYIYGNYGTGVSSFGRQRCQDRIITPCEPEDFIATNPFGPTACDPYHCGTSLCPGLRAGQRCRVESSVKPFAVGVKFGPPTVKTNPENNIGVCLKYEQLPCSE